MKKCLFTTLAAAGLVCVAAGCAGKVPPTTKAASVERLQCDRPGAVDDVRLLQGTTVLSAGPLYSHVTSNTSSEERVTGAQLLVRPPEGVSAERLTRVLQCHSAQVLLGQVDPAAFADDPTWLPDAWLDIEVKPQDGNFAIVLRADSVPDGLKVLHKATAFAESHKAPPIP